MKASGLGKYNCGGIPSHGTRKQNMKCLSFVVKYVFIKCQIV